MRRLQTAFAVMVAAALASPVTAGFIPLSTSASLDESTGDVTFTLDFSSVPDYLTRDEFGRSADAWRIDIHDDQGAIWRAFIQGPQASTDDRIYFTTRLGAIIETYDYSLTGTHETFTVPYSEVSNGKPFSDFRYTLFTEIYGISQEPTLSFSVPTPIVTPEPSSAIMLGMASVVAAGFGVKRRWPAMSPRRPVPSRRQ